MESPALRIVAVKTMDVAIHKMANACAHPVGLVRFVPINVPVVPMEKTANKTANATRGLPVITLPVNVNVLLVILESVAMRNAPKATLVCSAVKSVSAKMKPLAIRQLVDAFAQLAGLARTVALVFAPNWTNMAKTAIRPVSAKWNILNYAIQPLVNVTAKLAGAAPYATDLVHFLNMVQIVSLAAIATTVANVLPQMALAFVLQASQVSTAWKNVLRAIMDRIVLLNAIAPMEQNAPAKLVNAFAHPAGPTTNVIDLVISSIMVRIVPQLVNAKIMLLVILKLVNAPVQLVGWEKNVKNVVKLILLV